MALAGEQIDELGPDAIDAAALGGEEAEAEISIELRRGDGPRRTSIFSDLGHEYIRINAEYTT